MSRKLKRRLKPLFETRVSRAVYRLGAEECPVEMTVDHGSIDTDNKKATVSEVELELEGGEEVALFDLAHELIDTVSARLVLRSKAERVIDS